MNAHERADMLCREAEKLGLDNPTEGMISDAFADMEFNFAQEKRSIETRLTTANQTIESLKEERAILQSQVDNADITLEQVRMALKSLHKREIESLREESAEKDGEIARLRRVVGNQINRVYAMGEESSDCPFCQVYPAMGSPQEVPMCPLCTMEAEALTRIATLNQKEGN
jgi:predicted RNase H-like nuclease (RuvC/YqgF family)